MYYDNNLLGHMVCVSELIHYCVMVSSVQFPDSDVVLKAGTTVNAVASISNPLNKPMTRIVFFVEGAGLVAPQQIPAE